MENIIVQVIANEVYYTLLYTNSHKKVYGEKLIHNLFKKIPDFM